MLGISTVPFPIYFSTEHKPYFWLYWPRQTCQSIRGCDWMSLLISLSFITSLLWGFVLLGVDTCAKTRDLCPYPKKKYIADLNWKTISSSCSIRLWICTMHNIIFNHRSFHTWWIQGVWLPPGTGTRYTGIGRRHARATKTTSGHTKLIWRAFQIFLVFLLLDFAEEQYGVSSFYPNSIQW